MIDLKAARDWLRRHLPKGERLVLQDPRTLDRAAAVITRPAQRSP